MKNKIPVGWKLRTLEQCTVPSKTLNPSKEPDKEFTYIDISAIDNRRHLIRNHTVLTGKSAPSRARKKVEVGNLLFATTRPNLKNVAIVDKEYINPIASTGFCVLNPSNELEGKYLYYYLLSENIQEQILPFIRGTQYPAISDKDLLSCFIPLPSITEQKDIVKVLDELCHRIDKSITLLEDNLTNTRHLMSSVLNDVFEKEDWPTYEYDELQSVNLIGIVKSSKEQSLSHKYKYLKMNNITNYGTLDLSSYTCIEATKQDLTKFQLKKGDFLFNTRNSIELVGKTCVFDLDEDNVLFNNNILRTRFKDNVNPYFINYQFKSSPIQQQLEKLKSGTTSVAAIYYKGLAKLKLKVPKINDQNRVVEYLKRAQGAQLALQSKYTEQVLILKTLRSSILDAAFKGELNNKSWETLSEQSALVD